MNIKQERKKVAELLNHVRKNTKSYKDNDSRTFKTSLAKREADQRYKLKNKEIIRIKRKLFIDKV